MRAFLSQNVLVLRDSHRRYKELPNATAKNRALAKDADISPSQVFRVLEGQLGASIDVVESLARALEVRPQDLLTPYFSRTQTDAPRLKIHDGKELQRRRSA